MGLLRRAGLAFILMSTGKLISYVLQIVLTHTNTTYDYGEYAYAFSIANTVAVFASLGFNNSVLRFIPEYLRLKKYNEFHGFLKIAIRITLIGSISLGVVTFLTFLELDHGFDWTTALLFSSTVPLIAFIQYYSELARGLGKVSASIIPINIIQPTLVLLVLSSFYLATGKSNISLIAFSLAFSYIAPLLGLRNFLSRITSRWRQYSPIFSTRSWTNISTAMILMVGFQTILGQADVIIVGSILSPSVTGFYNVATKIAALTSFVLAAVNQVFAPNIASLYTAGKERIFQRELSKAAVLTFIPTLIMGLGLYVFGRPVLLMFGHNFIPAKGVLNVLIVAQVVNAATGPVAYILNLTGNHSTATKIYGTSAVVNIVSCYLAAKFGGTPQAVAWASMSSMILWNVWMHVVAVRRLNVWPSILGVFRALKSQG